MIRSVIREASSGAGHGSDPDQGAQDDIAAQEPKVDINVSQGSKYWYDQYGSSNQHGQPAKYISPNWAGTGNAAYATQPDAKTKGGPWETNPDYRDWEKKMADAKGGEQTGGQGDAPTGGAAGASTGGKKKGNKKKDDE